MKEYKFKALLEDAGGGGAFVRFPYDVKKEFGKGRVPIRCTIDGESYRGSLVKCGATHHMLGVLKSIREKIGKQTGDTVDIRLTEDKEQRKIAMPEDFAKILSKHNLLQRFEQLSFTHKREYVTWIQGAKKPETKKARMDKAIAMLQEKKPQRD